MPVSSSWGGCGERFLPSSVRLALRGSPTVAGARYYITAGVRVGSQRWVVVKRLGRFDRVLYHQTSISVAVAH